ncbi:MAG: hypothetical protein RMJ55_04055 [Roseiflexaceae bacterium]|nr:hypothetical protein [Roseiflexaceae bacterium]
MAFAIYQKMEYSVILTGSLSQKQFPNRVATPILAPRLTYIAPYLYAGHSGNWRIALELLHEVNSLVEREREISNGELIDFLSSTGSRVYESYKGKLNRDYIDVRIIIVACGKYRYPQDIEKGVANSLIIWESPRNFKPERGSVYAVWYADADTTNTATEILKLPSVQQLLDGGPLAISQTLDGIHALIAKINSGISEETNILLVGENEEHSLLKGNLIKLPNRALLFG